MEILTIGGFNEVGKNMTVVVLDNGNDAIIFDAGFYLPAVIQLQEKERQVIYTEKKLRTAGALPDYLLLEKYGLKDKVRAVLLGHAHLDHIGAVPFISHHYKAPVVGTPFTMQVLKKIAEDSDAPIPNNMVSIHPNSSFKIRGKNKTYEAEFINITHSTIQTSMIALHTDEGVVLYANDFKLDNTPILGLPPNYDALKRVAKEGVKVLIVDSLYSGSDIKTPSEKIARAMLEEVMLTVNNRNSALFVTTFSSHIARLKSIVDFGQKLNREIFFIGRSLSKYVTASNEIGMCPFYKKVNIGTYKRQVESILKKVERNREGSMVVCTGHQGENGSILDRLSRDKLHFQFKPKDHIIFSSKTIPVQENIERKTAMDNRFRKKGIRLFDNVHVSGHAGREDLRDLIELINPENIIPAHGSTEQLMPMLSLSKELGYKQGKNIFLPQDKGRIKLK